MANQNRRNNNNNEPEQALASMKSLVQQGLLDSKILEKAEADVKAREEAGPELKEISEKIVSEKQKRDNAQKERDRQIEIIKTANEEIDKAESREKELLGQPSEPRPMTKQERTTEWDTIRPQLVELNWKDADMAQKVAKPGTNPQPAVIKAHFKGDKVPTPDYLERYKKVLQEHSS